MSWQQEAREMKSPTAGEIAEWADGIVYSKTPDGSEVYFDPKSRTWRKVRGMEPGREPRV